MDSEQPIVTVIIPTYNRAEYLPQALESVLAQRLDLGRLEVIVVDDGSTDETPEVMRAFCSVSAVLYVRQANRREGAARNRGAARARAPYLAFLDSDDYYLPGKLRADLDRLERDDAPALVYSRAENVDAGGATIGRRCLPSFEGDLFWPLLRENVIPLSTSIVRAEAFRACGGFNEDRVLSGTADWELWVRLAARWPFGFVDGYRTAVRVHPSNMLGDRSRMAEAMLRGVGQALLDREVARRVGNQSNRVWSHMHVTIALNACANGHRLAAATWLLRAVRAWPGQAADPRFLGALARVAGGQPLVRAVRAGARTVRQRSLAHA